MQSPIFTGYNDDRGKSLSSDIIVNLYPEHEDGPKGPEIGLLISTPGLSAPLVTIGTGPIRKEYPAANGIMYVVSGNALYSCDSSYVATLLGYIGSVTGPVSIIGNPTQILVVDGTGGWVWNFITNTYSHVIPNAQTDCTNPTVAVYQDGFGIVNSTDNQIYQSNYNDFLLFASPVGGGGYTANNAYVQGNANKVVAMIDIIREVWVFKNNAAEVWINQGASGFAFTPLQGVYQKVGCTAPGSLASLDRGIVWMGGDRDGAGTIYMATGYQAKPISTFALASLFESFPVITDAISYSYEKDGHRFYVITFPSQDVTYCFDLMTGKWHQRAYFENGVLHRERANCHTYFNGIHIVGDYQNGNLYQLSDTFYTDNGQPRKWIRAWRALPPELGTVAMSFDSLQILMETGITVPSGLSPQIMLRWSDDGGYTWTGYFQIPAGKTGETSWRAIRNRLGTTKIGTGLDRVFEVSGTDPYLIKIVGAEWEGGKA